MSLEMEMTQKLLAHKATKNFMCFCGTFTFQDKKLKWTPMPIHKRIVTIAIENYPKFLWN